jgi:microcystin-dependent protein
MSIQIVDNFQLNAGLPIDTRMVASGSAARDAIQYKYEGLRVFDLSDGVPYAWRNGFWVSENSLSLFGFGTASYIPKYKNIGGPSGSNVLENSIIIEQEIGIIKRIGIDTTNYTFPTSGQPTATNVPVKLAVEGPIGSRNLPPFGGFFGDGSNISNINANNITSGTLTLNRIQTSGNVGDILTVASSQPAWVSPNSITVARSNFVNLTQDTSNSLRYFVFYDGTSIPTNDYKKIYSNNSKALTFQPSSGFIGINLSPNTTIPTCALDVNGQIKMRTGAANKSLLMSDSNGLASWKPQAEVSVPVGTIIMWGGPENQIPTNWVLCNGAAAPSNSALYSLLTSPQWNNLFGPGGKVPDLRERFVVGAGGTINNQNTTVNGSPYLVNDKGGFNEITLSESQIPSHIHSVNAVNIPSSGTHKHVVGQSTSNGSEFTTMRSGDSQRGGQAFTNAGAVDGAHTHTVPAHDTNTTGSGGSHENRPPYFALCYIIKIN